MEISIIIVTFNSSSLIEACLFSILDQVKDMGHELIIVDNDSKDGTREIIEKGFPQAILIRNDSNKGFAKANNLALQRAKGDFILLINPDVEWKRGELKEAIQFLKNHPEIWALGCRLVLEDGSWQKSFGHFPTLARELKEAFYLPRIFPRSQWMKGVYAYEDSLKPKPVDWVSCTFFLSQRKLIAEVGCFDERYFMYYEDIDLSKRIREKGMEIYYFPKIEVIHYQKGTSIIDYGESPYIYFNKFFGLYFAENLRYILLLKTFLRICIFFFLAFFPGRMVFRDKFKSNGRTFKFHLFEAPKVMRVFKIESWGKAHKNSCS
jgi:GT2 family glycosyltransferase